MSILDELLVRLGVDAEELTSGTEEAADNVEGSLKGIAAAGAGAVVGGLFVSGLNSAMDASNATSRLQQQLGLTAQEAERAGDVAGQVFRAGFGESIDEVSDSLGSVISSIDGMSHATNEELASMSTSALRLADLYEIDVADAAQAAGTMISNGLVKDGKEAFDVLTVAAQHLPKQMLEDIPATVNEYGKSWSRIGIDAKDAFSLMSQYVNAGGRDIDQAGDVLHEFARITSEETARAAQGFQSLGLDSKQMLADIGKGGEPARAALQKTLEAMRGIKDPAKQAALGVQLFGDMAGEGGDALWAMDPATAAASSGMDKVKGAADAANDAMAASASQQYDSLMRTLSGTIGDVLAPALKVVNGFLADNPDLVSAIIPVALAVAAALAIWAIAQWALNSALLANPYTWIILGVVALIGAIVMIATKTTWFQTMWHAMTDAVVAAWDWLWGMLKQGFAFLTDLFLNWTGPGLLISHWDDITGAIGTAIDWVKTKVGQGVAATVAIFDWFGALPGKIGAFFQSMNMAAAQKIGALIAFVRGIPGRVSDAVGNLGSLLYNAGANIIRGLINGVTGMIGALQQKFSSITSMIPDWKGPMDVDMRLLTPSGAALMTGLMDGIDNRTPALHQQLQGITSSIPGNVSAGVNRAATGSGGPLVLEFASAGGRVNDMLLELVQEAIRVRGGDPVQVLTPTG